MPIRSLTLAAAALVLAAPAALAFEPSKPECIAPASPGGGFDLTCRLAIQALQDLKLLKEPMRVTYMPGGIGAVAINTVNAQRADDPNLIVAISAGSALNIAQGKFGKYTQKDARWIAALGTDFGTIVVRADSPHKSLKDLLAAVKADPTKVVFGAGGTVGSQDWMKVAIAVKAVGVDPKSMRFVAFEGGGAVLTALLGGHIQAMSGDASEVAAQIEGGKVRVLAVMSEERLPGKLNNIPTAKEQGFDLVWPTWRGVYAAPKITEEQAKFWIDTFAKAVKTPEFAKIQEERGLFPYVKIGKDFADLVDADVERFRQLAKEAGLATN